MSDPKQTPLAIIGIGCLFPKAAGLEQYWANIKAGLDAITEVPATHWKPEDYFDADPKKPDSTYAKRGGFLPPVDFDPAEFGITPAALEATDSAQLLGLVAAGLALRDAGYGPERRFERSRVSVILGVTGTLELVVPLGARLGHPIWRRALAEAGITGARAEAIVSRISDGYVPWQENSFPGLLGNVVAGRIANRYDLGGTNCVVDAACASSLSAAHLAALELQAGRAEMVVTGGVDCFNDIFMYMCFSKTPALSPTGDSKPFDRKADGTILGEGLGMLVLKRLADAEKDGDRIYAVLKGIGSSSDGRGKAIYAPSAEGQSKALRAAYAAAGVSPATVELVEAHGTGTSVGDGAELGALTEVYREARAEGNWCALGSVKSMIGHTKAAAGAAGMIKAALALHHKVLPPTIKVDEPLEPLADERTPFYLNTELRPWLPGPHPRRAALSALGFGGSNFHAVLEEYRPAKSGPDWDGAAQLLAFSGADRAELKAALAPWSAPCSWDELRVRAAASRAAFRAEAPLRLCLVVERGQDAAALAAAALKALESRAEPSWSLPEGVWFGFGAPGKLAVLFPGQGSQHLGMGRDLFCRFPEAFESLASADEALAPLKLSELIFPKPAFSADKKAAQDARLRETQNAQPALGATGLAAWKTLSRFGLSPDAFAGHSYGELVALCAAGRLDERALFRLSRLRGELMAAGDGGRGAMLAVSAPLAEIEALLAQEKLDLVLANKNAPAQGVLSGRKEEIARAAAACESRGWRATALPVSAAFHSPLVSGALAPFREALSGLPFPAGRPVYANKSAAPYPEAAEAARRLLAEQLVSSVEFSALISRLHDDGVRSFVELGAGARLTGLVGMILQGREHRALALDSQGRRSGAADLARLLAALSAAGHALRLDQWQGGEAAVAALAARPKPKMSVQLTGANYRSTPPKNAPIPPETRPAAAAAPAASAPMPDAVRVIAESMNAMQRMQEQAAELHARFLEGQEQAQKTLQALIEQQQLLLSGRAVAPVAAAAPSSLQPPGLPPPAPSSNADSLLLAIVAEKTGYPAETINPDMDLESDLGIDSIKRVEILSAVREKLPGAPLIKPEHMGTLRTLRQIARFLGAGAPAVPAPAPAPAPASSADSVLLAIVAEKTGYPAETINPDMDLESDLGIDSIKRVEILSAVREKLPGAPLVKPEHMGALRTLRQIARFLGTGAAPAAPPPPAAPPQPAAVSGPLRRLVPRLVALPEAAERPAPKGPVWVAAEESFCRELIQALKARGVAAVPAGDGAPDELDGLIIAAPAARLAPGALWEPDSERRLIDAFALARRCGPALRRSKGMLMTVSRLDGAFGFDGLRAEQNPVFGGLAGLAKTAAREWGEARCRAVDLERDWKEAAQALAAEFLREGPVEVALSAAGRRGVELEERPAPEPSRLPLASGDLVIVTGGARGVTAAAALALARAAGPVIALIGRSPEPGPEPAELAACKTEAELKKALAGLHPGEPPKKIGERCRAVLAAREIRSTLEALGAAGAQAVYVSCDTRDPLAVSAAARELISRFGPARGFVHGAGVLADKRIEDKAPEQLEAVLGTKLAGLRLWLSALDLSELRLLALFSSSTARYGRVGQSDYAMANEALNKAAQLLSRRLPLARVVSFGWGPWDGGMVGPELKKLFASEGVGVIGLEEGGRFLVSELASDGKPVELVVLAPSAAAGPAAPAAAMFSRELSVEEAPFLASHVIDGRPVLPLAVAAEMLAHAALHGNPGLRFFGFDDLRVCKGVVLRGGPAKLSAGAGRARRDGALWRVPAELRGADGALHVKADVLLCESLPAAPAPAAFVDGSPYDGKPEQLYRRVLFHGPDMRFLRSVRSLSSRGVLADASAALPPASWLKRPWRDRWVSDPAALDAAFQALIVWSAERLGSPCLPSYAARFRQYRPFPQEGASLAASVVRSGDGALAADVDFLAPDGGLVARLEGYESTVDAGLAAAFRRNAVEAAEEAR